MSKVGNNTISWRDYETLYVGDREDQVKESYMVNQIKKIEWYKNNKLSLITHTARANAWMIAAYVLGIVFYMVPVFSLFALAGAITGGLAGVAKYATFFAMACGIPVIGGCTGLLLVMLSVNAIALIIIKYHTLRKSEHLDETKVNEWLAIDREKEFEKMIARQHPMNLVHRNDSGKIMEIELDTTSR